MAIKIYRDIREWLGSQRGARMGAPFARLLGLPFIRFDDPAFGSICVLGGGVPRPIRTYTLQLVVGLLFSQQFLFDVVEILTLAWEGQSI